MVPRDRLVLLSGLIVYGMSQSLLFIVGAPLTREAGLSEFMFGLVVSASNVSLALASPWWGRHSQAAGRKRVYLIGLAGFACGYALLGLGFEAGFRGWLAGLPLFALLFSVRLAYGAVAAAIQPAATAYIADTTELQQRAAGMALIAMSGSIGTIIGPAIGGALAVAGPVFPVYATAALAGLAIVVSIFSLPEPARQAAAAVPRRLRMTDRRVLPYLVGWCLLVGTFTAVQLVAAYYIQDRYGILGEAAVIRTSSVAFICMALATLGTQLSILRLWHTTPAVLLRSGFASFAAALLVLGFGPTLPFLYVGFAIMGLGFGCAAPGLNAAGSLSVRREEQGMVAGLLAAAPSVGMIFGPPLSGLLYRVSPNLPMTIGALLAIGMAVWMLFVRVPDPHAAETLRR